MSIMDPRSTVTELENIIEETTQRNTIPAGEVVIGVFIGVDTNGSPLVKYDESSSSDAVVAITTLPIDPINVGRQVALMFVNGEADQPIIIGYIRSQLIDMLDAMEVAPVTSMDDFKRKDKDMENAALAGAEHAVIDGKKVVINGDEEIILKCGDSSITLTKAGKIVIRGKYILNRSSGVNRILGGSVEVN